MRNETLTNLGLQTNFTNKIINLNLLKREDHHILKCRFQNGQVYNILATIERAVDNFNFKPISAITKKDDSEFQFVDLVGNNGNQYHYRLKFKEQNGVTYYSEILSC